MNVRRDSLAAVDAEALKAEAVAAVAAAADADALDELRVRFLGRKSPLKLALREVRDRETGMALNAARTAIEEALAEREHALAAVHADDGEPFDPTLPGEAVRRGRRSRRRSTSAADSSHPQPRRTGSRSTRPCRAPRFLAGRST